MTRPRRYCEVADCERPRFGHGLCKLHYRRKLVHGTTDLPPKKTELERFNARVDKSGGQHACWLWTAGRGSSGYGNFGADAGRTASAHRFAYELEHGPVPSGLEVDHICRNRLCVNPRHLRAVTRSQNHQNLAPEGYSSSGALGVHREGKKWAARVDGLRLGVFDTVEEAAEVARRARLDLFEYNDLDGDLT